MSLFKAIAKEIKTVKSMLDIPELKNERQAIRRKIDMIRANIEKNQQIINKREVIERTIRDLEDVWDICFNHEKEAGLEDHYGLAGKVIESLQTSVANATLDITTDLEQLSLLEENLQQVNKMLDTARANVK